MHETYLKVLKFLDTSKCYVSCTDGKITFRINYYNFSGKKNTTIEWDDCGKIGNKNKLFLTFLDVGEKFRSKTDTCRENKIASQYTVH